MKTRVKISVSSIKYGNKSPKGTDPDLYINEKSAYTQGLQKQIYTYEKITDHFLCALCEENDNVSETSGMKGLDTFQRCDKKIAKEMMKLEDSVSLITGSIQDLIDINGSDKDQDQQPLSYLCLCLDGEYGVCINTGLQSAYYYDSINMISLTPMAENPDKLIKMGIISDEQAELVRYDIIKSAKHINVSKMVQLVKDGVFVLMNSNMSGYFDELDVEAHLEDLKDPEQIGTLFMDESVKNDPESDYSVTVIKLDFVQSQVLNKKKTTTDRPKIKNSPPKEEPALQKEEDRSSSGQATDHTHTIKIPDVKGMRYKSQFDSNKETDSDEQTDIGRTRKIEPIEKKKKGKNHALSYFSSRIFTIIVIIGVLSGVVIGLVNLASLLFSDNIVPPVYSDTTDVTTLKKPDGTNGSTTATTTGTTAKQSETTTSQVTSGSEPVYTIPPNITEETEIIHVVKSGETLSHISLLYYGDQTKYNYIMEANDITNANGLQIGQKLKIPPLPVSSETTAGN